MIKVVVFDFDGVIIRRSEFFKQEAWAAVFEQYGNEGMEAFREAEKTYGGGKGGDRFDILRASFYALKKSDDEIENLVRETAQKFDTIVQQKILEAGITPEDRGVLERLSKRIPVYVNSATPREALERTIEALGLQSVIKGVLGRPNSKVENFELVASKEDAHPDEIVFVGDGDTDFKAASEFGCEFVGLSNEWNAWKKNEKPFQIIFDLHAVEEIVAKI